MTDDVMPPTVHKLLLHSSFISHRVTFVYLINRTR